MEKWKVGAYIRLSKDDYYSESDSIKNQKSIIKIYITGNEEFELVNYYVDNGYTGTNFNRPEFVQMCFDIVKKKDTFLDEQTISNFKELLSKLGIKK